MGIINRLPQIVINKIAAGEVIERPASVVKELVENAIDAKAARIDVHLDQGGKRLIRVADNGCGMLPEDIEMCVQSHTTSKLRDSDDLFFITTMGFRGEALPSLGAVSQLRIVSRARGLPEGCEIEVRGAEISPVRAAGCPEGTTVEARNLFFNIPARRKFLRTDNTEIGHVTDMLTKLALAFPGIHFRLTHGKRQMFDVPAVEDRSRRLASFFGKGLVDSLIPVEWGRGTLSMTGFIAPPTESRASGRLQYVFLNGRFIQNRFIGAAIREAYKGLLTVGRKPIVFLFIQVDPREVDVNVHPTKIEVRFRDAQGIYLGVLNSLRSKLNSLDLRPEIRDIPGGPLRSASGGAGFSRAGQARPGGQASSRPMRLESPSPASAAGSARQIEMPPDFLATPPSQRDIAGGAVQLHDAFIVEQQPNAIVITDQHALHERILYDQIRRRLARAKLESQRMLMPVTVELARDEVLTLLGSSEELERLGIGIEEFGSNVIAVQALPAMLSHVDVKEFVGELLAAIQDSSAGDPVEKLRERLMQTIACKGAVKAGERLNPDEIRSLLRRRDDAEKPVNTCPHGRPVSLVLTLDYLEKHFKRT